jgi:hypothetical protein
MALPLLKEEDFEIWTCTDWETIRERRQNYGLSAPDETGPARIMALLAELGLACREEKGLVFLAQVGSSLSTITLVSASELFACTRRRPSAWHAAAYRACPTPGTSSAPFNEIWKPRVPKQQTMGIHGILF